MGRAPRASALSAKRVGFAMAAIALALATGIASARQGGGSLKAPVVFNRQTLFILYARIGGKLPEERAAIVADRLKAIADARSLDLSALGITHGPSASEITLGETPIAALADGDARALGLPRRELAERYAALIRQAIETYRAERSVPMTLRGIGYAAVATLALVITLRLLAWLFVGLCAMVTRVQGTRIKPLRIHQTQILTVGQVTRLAFKLAGVGRLAITVAILYLYLTIVFGFFPWTEGYAATLLGAVSSQVRAAWNGFVAEIPNLLFVVLIIIAARVVLKVIRFFFTEIETGAITFTGFERDWAMPTYKLVRLLVVALAVIAAFPFIPGSKSPIFQGVSVFLGVLLSFGSSGAVANMVAGVVLTYMRPFRVGHRVKVADTVGDVVEKTLLVTRIRTIKNVEVTIPNSMVLGAHIINYSANGTALILHTTVTIGYDAPWRQVHELLIAAALKTEHVLGDPPPFVFQTALNDFYVSYEINAYTDQPGLMATTYSDLHRHIQDTFNEAGVEIMSPHYSALRDGHQTTVPEVYLSDDYRAPGFRVEPTVGARSAGRPDRASE